MTLPEHLFPSDTDGALYDTRNPAWSSSPPVRKRYRGARKSTGLDLQDIKAALRAGGFACPGGYPLYFVTRDGGALSFKAVLERWREVVGDHLSDSSTGWRVEAMVIADGDSEVICDHTGEVIAEGPEDGDEPDGDEPPRDVLLDVRPPTAAELEPGHAGAGAEIVFERRDASGERYVIYAARCYESYQQWGQAVAELGANVDAVTAWRRGLQKVLDLCESPDD